MLKRIWQSLFTEATGLPGVLWVVVGYLLSAAPTPAGDWVLMGAVVFIGLGLQMLMYVASHRPILSVDRSPVVVWLAMVIGTLCCLAALSAIAWDVHVARFGRPSSFDGLSAMFGLCMAAVLVASGFRSRLKLIRMRTDYRSTARLARQASRLLVPVGTFNINRVVERLDELVDRQQPASLATQLDEFLDEFRVRGDSRYARAVPWASAVCVIEAYVNMRTARCDHQAESSGGVATLVTPIVFERNETLDHAYVRPSLICSLLDVLADDASIEQPVTVQSFADAGRLHVRLMGGIIDSRRAVLAAREVNLALADGASFDCALNSTGEPVVELAFSPPSTDATFDWSQQMVGEEYKVLSNSRFSNGVKQSFRLDGMVIRAQRVDLADPKPTLIEDEYLILRRLMDASPAFPRVLGCGKKGVVQWLSYQFEKGQPLVDWLKSQTNEQQWFRIIAEVDNIVRCMRDNAVAHRDLNPGNVIVRTDGSLALIDFDQAVADDERFLLADTNGSDAGTGKNDIQAFIERCDLMRKANHAIANLGEAWQELRSRRGRGNSIKSPYHFEFAGQAFPGWINWFDEWTPLAPSLAEVAGKRVLNFGGGIGLLDAFLAVLGAKVTSVEMHPQVQAAARFIAEAAQVSVDFDPGAAAGVFDHDYDLVIAIGSGFDNTPPGNLATLLEGRGQVMIEIAESLQDARQLVESKGWIWRGVAGCTPRLRPVIVAAHKSCQESAEWLKVRR